MGKIKEVFEIVRESGATFSVHFDEEAGAFIFTMEDNIGSNSKVQYEVYPDEIGPNLHYILENMLADLTRWKGGL